MRNCLIVSYHKTDKTYKTAFFCWGKRPTGSLSGGNPVGCRHTLFVEVKHGFEGFVCFVIISISLHRPK